MTDAATLARIGHPASTSRRPGASTTGSGRAVRVT
jgi:hypothetical protein